MKHNKKLSNLYGGHAVIPTIQSYVTNLSSHPLTVPEQSLLNKGLNFCVKRPIREIDKKLEMEKLFMSILEKRQSKQISITSEDNFKTKLKCFGIKHDPPDSEVLTREERNAIKTLRDDKCIIIQRPDKGGGVVIMDKEKYDSKLSAIISDPEKFVECASSQTEKVKKEINIIANQLKE
jgi:hypothetical protein